MTSQPAQPREKRGTVSARRRRQLLLLVADLQQLQTRYPTLREDLQDNIDKHLHAAERTRALDVRDVLNALELWREMGLTAQEIVDDTGLSDRTVRSTLDGLLATNPPLVAFCERARDGEGGKGARVFRVV